MKKNTIYWILFSAVLIVSTGIFYSYWKTTKESPVTASYDITNRPAQDDINQNVTPQYPYFPANTETFLDEEKMWQTKAFQPIFNEYSEASIGGYLVINYADSNNGNIKEAKIFLGRQISYTDKEAGERTVMDSVKLKELLKAGDQFGIYYLSKIPAHFSIGMPYCQVQVGQKTECLWAYYKQESDKKGENIFYPFFIYRILKK